jgi:hypothetical protein
MIYLIFAFEVICFLVSLIIYRKSIVPLYLRFFPGFLFITATIDIVGQVLKVNSNTVYYPMYNIYVVFEFIFYSFVLYHLVNGNRIKVMILYTIVLYSILALTYSIVIGNTFNSPAYIIGAIALVYFCLYYFYEFFKFPFSNNPVHEPAFWICFGLMFFKSCTIPLFGIYNYLESSILENKVINLILSLSNYFLYTSLMIAFICFYRYRTLQQVS